MNVYTTAVCAMTRLQASNGSMRAAMGTPVSSMDIRTRISTAIAPWRTRTDVPPPFTCAELVVLALVLNDEPMSDLGICLWAWSSFAFYTKLGATAVWKYWDGDEGRRSESEELLELAFPGPARPSGFQRALKRFDVPVRLVNAGEDGKENGSKWTVEPSEAMLFLRPALWRCDQQRGSFPFLRLPPELRNMIYHMVFAFPPSGVMINAHEIDTSGTVYTSSRLFDLFFDFEHWKDNNDHLPAGRVSDVLRLLLVNRQVRSEALYVFASINTFYFPTPAHMHSILSRMSEEHRNNIRYVAFTHAPGGSNGMSLTRAFALLAKMEQLRTLRIFVDQEEFRRYYHFYPLSQPIDLMRFDKAPAIYERTKVLLEGDYPREIEAQIRSEPVETIAMRNSEALAKIRRPPSVPSRPRCHWGLMLAGTWACALTFFVLIIL